MGMAVSKKVGNSPQRSRVKRVLREWFRLHNQDLAVSADLVFIARAGAPGLSLGELEQELGPFTAWFNRRHSNGKDEA
jgi:ribonuclease P protein component